MTPQSPDFARLPLYRLLPLASRLVPAPRRADWLHEWQAELWHLRCTQPGRRQKDAAVSRLSLAYGLLADAAWLRWDWARETVRASAYSCLWALAAVSLLFAAIERVSEGSWRAAFGLLTAHFLGGFVFVATPAVVVAIATYPLRPLRCHGQHAGGRRTLSARARWKLFLAAKIALTLVLGFLLSMVATGPARMLLGRTSDWFELFSFALTATAGMRWALLDQEARCQRCLRTLSQPTRVGPPSHNFLHWSGTEMACADGHGLLHVPEMQGSWCWYDQWVELEPGWTGLFTS